MSLTVKDFDKDEGIRRFEDNKVNGVRTTLHSTQEDIGNLRRLMLIQEQISHKTICWHTYNLCPKSVIEIGFCTEPNEAPDKKLRQAIVKGNPSIPPTQKAILDSLKCAK